MFGNPETTTGGNALKFFSSQRLEVRKGEKITEDKEEVWYAIKVKVAKNKIAPPFKKAELPVRRWQWYDPIGDVIEAGLLLGAIARAWAFYTIGSEKIQGKERLGEYLQKDQKLLNDLEKHIQTKIKQMRMGEKVLNDAALDDVQIETEGDDMEIDESGEE